MPDRPNVVWIMSDQHNAKCTGWGEFPTPARTPELERLAAQGTRFDRAFCQNPICTPSRMSYLTGQYPSNHGYYGLGGEAPARDLPSLFSVASDLGYRTGAFGKIHTPSGFVEPHADVLRATNAHPGTSNARTVYEEVLRERGVLADRDDAQLQEWDRRYQAQDARPSRMDYADTPERWSVDQTERFVRESGDEPFFAWLSLPRPHQIWTPPEEFWEQYPTAGEIDLPPSAFEDLSDKPPHQSTPDRDEEVDRAIFEPRTHEALLRRKLKGYLGCVSMVDDCVGRVLDFLEAEGLREETIVIYCADHGDFAAEHGFPEKAPGISYDAVTRVPFVWSWPGEIEAGAVVEELVETVDVFPTLLSLMAGRDAPSADGHDLSGYLTGEGEPPDREYAITENPWGKCVRTESQKLTLYPRGFSGEGSEEFAEFHDLETDRWERENLADERPEAVARHRRLLYEHLATARRPATTHPPVDGDAPDGTVWRSRFRRALSPPPKRRMAPWVACVPWWYISPCRDPNSSHQWSSSSSLRCTSVERRSGRSSGVRHAPWPPRRHGWRPGRAVVAAPFPRGGRRTRPHDSVRSDVRSRIHRRAAGPRERRRRHSRRTEATSPVTPRTASPIAVSPSRSNTNVIPRSKT